MERYKRQEMILDQGIVREAKVLVVGAGTIGNEVIKNLVLLGTGLVTVVDNDVVAEVNLNRSVLFREEDIGKPKADIAAKRARHLNPYVNVIGRNCDVIYDIGSLEYGGFDCVVLAVDNLEARVFVNKYCYLNRTPLIDTGIGGPDGNVFVTYPPDSSCLQCRFTEKEYNRLEEKYSCLRVGLDWEEPKVPMVITSASVIGGIAAQECIKLLHARKGKAECKTGVMYKYYGEIGTFDTWKVPRKGDCRIHAKNTLMDTLSILPIQAFLNEYVEEVKEKIKKLVGADIVGIRYDKEIVYSVACRVEHCGYSAPIAPTLLGQFQRPLCSRCGSLSMVPNEKTAELKNGYTLASLSVPSNHLLDVVFSIGNSVCETQIVSKKE